MAKYMSDIKYAASSLQSTSCPLAPFSLPDPPSLPRIQGGLELLPALAETPSALIQPLATFGRDNCSIYRSPRLMVTWNHRNQGHSNTSIYTTLAPN